MKLAPIDVAASVLIAPGMEALAEQIIATYLTRGGKVFVVPQYAIPAPTEKGDWACSDVVALDFGAKEVVVVDLARDEPGPAHQRVAERQTRWLMPIRAKLTGGGLVEQACWKIRFLGFVRSASVNSAKRPFVGHAHEVAFPTIEDAAFPCAYWGASAEQGLPR